MSTSVHNRLNSVYPVAKSKLKVMFDCDGVLWDIHNPAFDLLERHGFQFSRESIGHHDIQLNFPAEHHAQVCEVCDPLWISQEFYDQVLIIREGFDLLAKLMCVGISVELCTARIPELCYYTWQSAAKVLQSDYDLQLPITSVFNTGSTKAKSRFILLSDYSHVIEDNPKLHELLRETSFAGKAYLLQQPWNSAETDFKRWSFMEIERDILGEFAQSLRETEPNPTSN